MENQYITKKGYEKLRSELNDSKEKRKEIADRLEKATGFGDLRENSEFDEATTAFSFNEGRIAELEYLINTLQIIKYSGEKNKVSIGSKILVSYNNEIKEFVLVNSIEADPVNGKISDKSVIGKHFLNKKEKDIIKINFKNKINTYRIIKIFN